MRIAQVAPLTEAIPPKLYGGTERVVYWLIEELVALGHDVTLFASGDSCTSAKLEAFWPRALRLDGSIRDPNALHVAMLEHVRRQADQFIDLAHLQNEIGRDPAERAQREQRRKPEPADEYDSEDLIET